MIRIYQTWKSWISLCLLNSIKHHIFCFFYHMDGPKCTRKQFLTVLAVLIRIYQPLNLALSTIWLVKEIPLNNFVRPAVLIRIRVIDYLDEDVSKPEHESTCAFWIASNILFLALSTIWMVKDVVSNLKDQDIAKPECHTSTYAVWIPTNIIFFASSTIWMVKEIPLKQFLTDQSVLTPTCPDFMPFHVQCLKCLCIFGKSPIFTMLTR